jgi:multidrug transporter EmrE-like cation transporter
VPTGVLLAIAIAVEVAATVSLRSVDGLSRPLPLAIVVVGYGASFWLLSLVLKHLSVGTTYAIWAGAGTAAVALIGIVALGEPATALKLASIALIVAGVIGLNLSGAH